MRLPLLAVLLLTGCTSTGYASLDTATLEGDRLTVQGFHGTCETPQGPVVDEDDEQVRVTVPVLVSRGDCDDAGVVLDLPVRLDAPLGSRQVVSGRSGRPLPVLGRDRCLPGEQQQQLEQYLGLTEQQVRERAGADGYRAVRVTCRDGRRLVVTSDARPDRVSLAVDGGRVSGASAG